MSNTHKPFSGWTNSWL